ncbi:DUF4232 domain-containing protein [Streptomyces lydicus]|uniref:DUF4232 domain-containing protein n=1 Tax=Streptomyces lydicus TaxID=47763 RepID=UPI0037B6CA1D
MSPHLTPRHARHAAAAVLAAVAAVALTACQEGKTNGAGAPSAAASQGAASGNASGGTAGSSQGTGGAGSGGQPTAARSAASADNSSDRCTAASMRLRLGAPDAGAGNIRYPLVFTNNGKQTCTLRGFPGVSLLARDAQTIGKPATREQGAGGPVRLAPGASAHAVLHTINEGLKGSGCWKSADLVQAYPPGSKEAMTAHTSGLRVCGDEFSVTAVAPGTSG